eukprot:TRINITY_DN6891_c0_g1_i2.p1 TRINITY_DN6891_c0_g1~~TRINITY_DN6891_c0_g1_i2.p1  ORF type:complete len:186 (+),score=2.72 TRINITY_DN6891_c0_g1_i2:196-753(+)
MLRHYAHEKQGNWEEMLPLIEYAYNTAKHASTGSSPFQLLYGENPPPPGLYVVGQLVWLRLKPHRYPSLVHVKNKLAYRFAGPFHILSKINDVAYRLELPADWHMCRSFHVSMLKPVVQRHPELTRPPPITTDLELTRLSPMTTDPLSLASPTVTISTRVRSTQRRTTCPRHPQLTPLSQPDRIL